MERTQYTFYESFYKALSRIRKDADRAKAYDAITRFALYGEEPDLDALPDHVAIAFEVIRPNLEASRRKAEGGSKGKPTKERGKITKSSLKDTAKISKRTAKQEKEQEQEKEQDKEQDKEKGQMSNARARAFVPPTVAEVAAYVREKGYQVDAESFVAFYASKGWKVGSQPMKDWRAAVVTWSKRERQERRETGNPFLEIANEEARRFG